MHKEGLACPIEAVQVGHRRVQREEIIERQCWALAIERQGLVAAQFAPIGVADRRDDGETVKTAPAFRSAYEKRRCLVPADAFYEWKVNGKTKQPYAIAMRDREPLALAGLWENWKDPATQERAAPYEQATAASITCPRRQVREAGLRQIPRSTILAICGSVTSAAYSAWVYGARSA